LSNSHKWNSNDALDVANRRIPVLVGPTAIGKSDVVNAIARVMTIGVLSADSRQVYRRLDIGTAKPDRETLDRVPHFGIDVAEVGESYSAGQFARDAAAWLSALAPSRSAIIVGGTGFYVRALTEGLFEEPQMSTEARRRIRRWAVGRPDDLKRWATRLDPAFGGGTARRATRVVEVALLTGHPLSHWQQTGTRAVVRHPLIVRMSVPRSVLHDRIEKRVVSMLARGWVDEVASLLEAGVPKDAAGLDAVGYREIVQFLDGRLRHEDLQDTIVRNTRRYAKRQETWFRHQLGNDVTVIDGTESPQVLARDIMEIWERDVTRCVSA